MGDDIGSRIREARARRGLTLRSVASSVGLSASLLSRIETGRSRPSVTTLTTLAAFFGISLDEMAVGAGGAPAGGSTAARGPVQRARQGPTIEVDTGVHWERLAGSSRDVDQLVITYEPGVLSGIEGGSMSHAGIEYAYLLSGELTLQLDGDTFVLRPGDSFSFDARRDHLIHNHTSRPAHALWLMVGRCGGQWGDRANHTTEAASGLAPVTE